MNQFIPRNFKYRKVRKKIRKNLKKKANFSYILNNSEFGLKALKGGLISSSVLEAARRTIVRKIKKKGTLFIKVYPYVPITSKSVGIRMGKGAGNIDHWVYPVREGQFIFELKGVSKDIAKNALMSASYKIPFKCKFFTNY